MLTCRSLWSLAWKSLWPWAFHSRWHSFGLCCQSLWCRFHHRCCPKWLSSCRSSRKKEIFQLNLRWLELIQVTYIVFLCICGSLAARLVKGNNRNCETAALIYLFLRHWLVGYLGQEFVRDGFAFGRILKPSFLKLVFCFAVVRARWSVHRYFIIDLMNKFSIVKEVIDISKPTLVLRINKNAIENNWVSWLERAFKQRVGKRA